jgi:hypothetical protein
MTYIETLTKQERETVASRALKERPYYFNAVVADAKALGANVGDLTEQTQLSEDGEAFLILLPSSIKNSALMWTAGASAVRTNPDLMDLFGQILTARSETLKQVDFDIGNLTRQFNDFRQSLVPPVDIVDVSQMLRAFNTTFDALISPQRSQIHHRIMDFNTVERYKALENGNFKRELTS